MTLAERLEAVNSRPAGFDYMRLILAIAVIAMHTVIVCYGQLREIALWESPLRPVLRLILPMFFVLSGFLVAGSLERSRTIGMFLGLRIIRIFPALSVEVILSALVLGPIFTTLTLTQYFLAPEFHNYFFNIIGHIHYTLPGVFESNPHPKMINGQLWTVPYELYCYAALALLALVGAVRRRWLLPVAAVGMTAVYLVRDWLLDGALTPMLTGPLPGVMLVVCFLIGVGFYLYREVLAYKVKWGLAALALSALLVSHVPFGEYIAPLFIGYGTVILGLTNPSRSYLTAGADYSYGIFLYGYPIQQTIAALGPWTHHWFINLAGTLLIAFPIAMMSWHWIEKPALKLRTSLKAMENSWLAWRLRPASAQSSGRSAD